MKKKVVTMLLCSAILCTVTACGSRATEPVKTITEKTPAGQAKSDLAEEGNVKTSATSTETVSEAPLPSMETGAGVGMISAEIKNEAPTVPAESAGVDNDSKIYGKTQVDDLLVNDYVFEQDKSADYGVFSTSSKDAEAFLKEDGTFSFRSLGETGNYDYSGRFAYPEVKTFKRLQNLYLEYRSDMSTHYVFSDGGENQGVIGFYLGHDNYKLCSDLNAHVDGIADWTEFATLKTPEGENVLVYVKDTAAKDKCSVYYYKLGAFSVKVQRNANDELYTPDEFQEIMNNIVLQ